MFVNFATVNRQRRSTIFPGFDDRRLVYSITRRERCFRRILTRRARLKSMIGAAAPSPKKRFADIQRRYRVPFFPFSLASSHLILRIHRGFSLESRSFDNGFGTVFGRLIRTDAIVEQPRELSTSLTII